MRKNNTEDIYLNKKRYLKTQVWVQITHRKLNNYRKGDFLVQHKYKDELQK